MLITKLKKSNKKGFTLIEMVVAVSVTAILAVCLSMMLLPVMNTYSNSKLRAVLYDASSRIMEALTAELCDAEAVYLATNAASLPEDAKCKSYDISGISLIKNVLILKEANAVKSDFIDASYLDGVTVKAKNGATYNKVTYSTIQNSFYFMPVKNANDNNSLTAIKVHFSVEKNGLYYEMEKTIVCENLVVSGKKILTSAEVNIKGTSSVAADTNKRYSSLWYKAV